MKMRKVIPVMLLVLAGTWAAAEDPARAQAAPATEARETKGKKEMTATVVSTDLAVKTITIRSSAQGSQPETLPVAEGAAARLADFKAGEKVKLVLTTDPTTNKETVTSIQKPSPGSEKH
jgi:hypothetical protein